MFEKDLDAALMSMQPTKVHLGCGLITPAGWINVDASWNARLAKYPFVRKVLKAFHVLPGGKLDIPWSANVLTHDVRRPLPFQDNSLSAIYASHLLEHLYLEEAKRLLRECFRVLLPGGFLRVVVPDLRAVVLEYVGETPFAESSGKMDGHSPADRMNRRLHLRDPEPPAGNLLYRIYQSVTDFHSHKWMYDAHSLKVYFEWGGFEEVREMQLHQSRIAGIEVVEEPSRILNGQGTCIEGSKPDESLHSKQNAERTSTRS